MVQRVPAMRVLDDARAARARGISMIQVFGSPVLALPEHAQRAVMGASRMTFERDTRGSLSLREAIAHDLLEAYAVVANPERELLITHGAMHGLAVTFRALLEIGDEVILPAPTFFYDGTIRSTGARPVYVPTLESEEWRWDFDRFDAAVSDKTRAIVVCNPTNPTAYLPRRGEVEALVEWASSRNLLVIADEAYARFVFDGADFTPQMTFRERYDKIVTVTSLSKNYGFSNWRVGYVHAVEDLLERIHEQFEWDALDVGPIPQAAAQAVIEGPQKWIEDVLATYQENRDRLQTGLAEAGLSAVLPAGCPFAFVDFSSWDLSGRDLESALLEGGLAVVAGDGFEGPPTHARIPFGGSPDAIDALLALFNSRVAASQASR